MVTCREALAWMFDAYYIRCISSAYGIFVVGVDMFGRGNKRKCSGAESFVANIALVFIGIIAQATQDGSTCGMIKILCCWIRRVRVRLLIRLVQTLTA